jgi:hypothetical protein
MEHLQDQQVFLRPEQNQLFASVQDDLGDAIAVLGYHGLAEERIGLLTGGSVRSQVILPASGIERIESTRGNEDIDLDRLVGLRPEPIELVGIDDYVAVPGVLVAGDNLVVRDLPVQGTDLLVLDAAMAVGMKLVEVDLASAGSGSAVGLDGNTDETELEITFPTGTCGHGKKTPCHLRVGIVP